MDELRGKLMVTVQSLNTLQYVAKIYCCRLVTNLEVMALKARPLVWQFFVNYLVQFTCILVRQAKFIHYLYDCISNVEGSME